MNATNNPLPGGSSLFDAAPKPPTYPEAPRKTASGADIPVAWHINPNFGAQKPWQATRPNLHHLKSVKTEKFNWADEAVVSYILCLIKLSMKRRIKDFHTGLAREAAQAIVEQAEQVLWQECLDAGVVFPINTPNESAIAELVAEFTDNDAVKRAMNEMLKHLRVLAFADPDFNNKEPYIATSFVSSSKMTDEAGRELIVKLTNDPIDPMVQINRALDFIEVFSGADRIKWLPLETLLTSIVRVHYVVFGK